MTPISGFVALLLFANAYKHNEPHFKNLETPGSTLVVCSTGNPESPATAFVKSLWKHNDGSYQGKTDYITMDIEEATIPGHRKHIKGDAATYTVTEPNIRTIYLERPHPCDLSQPGAFQTSTIASYVKNLLPALRDGGELIIEWDPFIVQRPYFNSYKNTPEPIPGYDLENDNAQNPFMGFFEANVIQPAFLLAINKQFSEATFQPWHITEARKIAPIIDKLLTFYTTQQSSQREALNKKIAVEYKIFDLLWRHNIDTLELPEHPDASIEQFNQNADHVIIPSLHGAVRLADAGTSLRKPNGYYVVPVNKFLTTCLSNHVLCDLAVIQNHKRAIACLEKLGLTHVTLKYSVSAINKRRVWLLSGFKRAA